MKKTIPACLAAIVAMSNMFSPSTEAKKAEDEIDVVHYGVDVSFPAHGRVSTNYPSLPHNVDPENNPVPDEYKDMPLQPLGDRQKAYLEHIEGCRAYYSYNPKAQRECDIYEYDRMLMARRQPQSMQNYTEIGFKKVRAPSELRSNVQAFWKKNENNQKPENWPDGNTYHNNWKAPTYMVSVDDPKLRGSGASLKDKIWEAARETLEDWTGEELSPTSMYGIRVYTEGSVLPPHVDRLPLVTSAMILVEQDVDEPWPTEVYGHDGRAHNVTLERGDMLLFESHSILHGRPFPLKGRYCAFLFVHFEPVGHSLRHKANVKIVDVDEQYKRSAKDRTGGQSASFARLPPYIKAESPEEEHWREMHPEGWKRPVTVPSRDKSPKAPVVHRAAAEGNVKAIENFLSSKPDMKEKAINKRDEHGWQPIHEGAAGGHKDVVEYLVSQGADVNVRTNGGTGGTPLYLAIENNGVDNLLVEYMKTLGALSIGPEL